MKFVNKLIFILLMLISTLQVVAGQDDPCAGFENASIDSSLIAQMLEAAKDGYLYRIKPASSRMGFCVDSSIGMVNAEFRNFTGGLMLDSNNPKALVSIQADSLKSDGIFIESMMKSDSFFDVKNYEDIVFVSTDFEWTGKTRAVLKGTLSLHGVTRPVAFYVEITDVKQDAGGTERILVKATTTVQRSAFGLHTLSPLVSDRVNLCMSVEAEKHSPDQALLDQGWL